MEYLFGLLGISFAMERCLEWIFTISFLDKINKKFPKIQFKTYLSIICGLCIAYFGKIDILSGLLCRTEMYNIGFIFSGILLAGGSNIINDIISSLKNVREDTKGIK